MRRIASVFAASLLSLAACESDSSTPTNPPVTRPDATTGTDASAPSSDTSAPSTGADTSAPSTGSDTSTGPGPSTDTSGPGPSTDTSTGPGPSTGTAAGICPGIASCANECQDQACFDACQQAADSEAELAAFGASYQCPSESGCITWAQNAQPTTEDIKGYINCIGANCLEEEVGCAQGATAGTGACAAINGCLMECGEGDTLCERGCYAAATASAVADFIALNICAGAECYGVASADRQACVQQAIGSTGPCSQKYTTCFGNVGAGAGAGGAGGFGKAFFMPASWSFKK
jgi:hypothetical protein